MPTCLAMGISYDGFWDLNVRKIEPIVEGYKLKRKAIDEQNWLLGGYIFNAVSIVAKNATRKKGQKVTTYFEEFKHPFSKEVELINENNMTEEEKRKKTEALFTNLEIMAANFNLKNKQGK